MADVIFYENAPVPARPEHAVRNDDDSNVPARVSAASRRAIAVAILVSPAAVTDRIPVQPSAVGGIVEPVLAQIEPRLAVEVVAGLGVIAEWIGGGAGDCLLVAPGVVLGYRLHRAGRVRSVGDVALLVEDVFGRRAAGGPRDQS